MKSGPGGKVIAAGMIGNELEWYDFAIYGYLASSVLAGRRRWRSRPQHQLRTSAS
jgi:hypothetical protein